MKLVLLKMEQAHPVIVKNTKDNKPTLHTCTTGHQTKPNWKGAKVLKCQITTNELNSDKIIGICPLLLNLIDTTAHFYSDVCPQLTKYYVTIQLAEKHFVSQETFRRKIRCKILCYHLSFPSLSLFLADLTTQISLGVRSYSSVWAPSWRWWRWRWWRWWRCWWWWWWWVRFGEKLSSSIHQSDVLVSRVSFCSSVWTPRKYQKR